MSIQLTIAVIAITSALVLYTIGVFTEKHSGILKKRHLALFWSGFLCDTIGTLTMSYIARAGASGGFGMHAVTGVAAIALMAFHATWATVVLVRDDPHARANFHRLSVFVWLFWLIPYVCGMLVGIPSMRLDATLASFCAIAVALVIGLCLHTSAHRRSAHHAV